MDLESKKQAFFEDVKPEVQSIGKKFFVHSKAALIEAAAETKTPLDDMALQVLLAAYEKKLLEKVGG